MPKRRTLSGREVAAALEKNFNFSIVRQRGSHIVLSEQTTGGKVVTVVPNHREVARGTPRGILKLAKISAEDFFAVL